MKIAYRHFSAPNEERILDTVKTFRGTSGIRHALGGESMTQEEWDRKEVALLERDLKTGVVLSYNILS